MNLALIAHDGKKLEMLAFVLQNRQLLMGNSLFATGTTGGHIEQTGINVERLLSVPKDGMRK